MGLPEIDIRFQQNAVSAIRRSENGIVAVIIKDETDTTFSLVEYSELSKIESDKFTADNLKILKDAFKVSINKLMVVRIGLADELSVATEILKNKVFDWCCVMSETVADHDALVSYIKTRNQTYSKKVKCVVYKATTTDDIHIINLLNDNVTRKGETEVTSGHLYVLRLAALFASLSIEQSATYYELTDLVSVSDMVNVNETINQGGLVLINDEEKIRVARGVNSLVTTNETLTEDMKSILIVEAMDIIYYDIHENYKDNFIGQYKNSYDNQALFLSAINGYFKDLAKENVLDSNYENKAMINIAAQRDAWVDSGTTAASLWTDQTVKNNAFKNKMFLAGQIKILNAMEDLSFNIQMA